MLDPMHEDELTQADTEFADRLDGLMAGERPVADVHSAEAFANDDEELNAMATALSAYKAEGLEWAERRSATLPVPSAGSGMGGWVRSPRWAVAGVCALVLGTVAGYLAVPDSFRQEAASVAPAWETIRADNELMTSVDEALNSAAEPTEHTLGLTQTVTETNEYRREE